MKPALVLALAGLVLFVVGLVDAARPSLPWTALQLLEHELSHAEDRGHRARLLLMAGTRDELIAHVRALSPDGSTTVLALSHDAAVIVPSHEDRALRPEVEWRRLARRVTAGFLRNRDIHGAAVALVRAYSLELMRHGILPSLPPLPPLLLPDTEMRPEAPHLVAISGFGIVLLVLAGARATACLAARRGSRPT